MSTQSLSSAPTISPSPAIPVLLLKTQSQPHDSYHDYFSTSPSEQPPGDNENASSSSSSPSATATTVTNTPRFQPLFVPVLDHHPNTRNLEMLQDLLRSEQLGQKYGGMIFTSQRAVEAWTEVVKRVEGLVETREDGISLRTGVSRLVPDHETTSQDVPTRTHQQSPLNDHPQGLVDDDFIFPLYSVGPATSRALNTLLLESSHSSSSSSGNSSSPFSRLRPSVLGEHTGNGANLAQYILSHYNGLLSRGFYTLYDAARLPFTPLIGSPGGERVDREDERRQKKGLLFLVGEQRRDIIPKTLADKEGKLAPEERIAVDEVEVYVTGIMESFKDDFGNHIDSFKRAGHKLVVVVVFSPQGCEAMLRSLGYIDEERRLTGLAKERWQGLPQNASDDQAIVEPFYVVIATIGPTTRDHLKDQFGFEADVCAAKPTPQGVGEGVLAFLRQKEVDIGR